MVSERLLQLLVCPSCRGPLMPESHGDLLRSRCGLLYPVVNGIPRLFAGPLRRVYAQDFPDVVRKYPVLAEETVADGAVRRKLQTRESFGYEWTVYSEMRPEWEENAKFYFEPVGLDGLSGRLLLDAGCGTGRHAYYAAKAGAEVIALDFSRAIDVARKNCETFADVHFVQADLTAPPLRAQSFDLVYSFGVLHHLPDPEAGFRALLPLIKPGGQVTIYLYHWPAGQPLKQALLHAVRGLRALTTRMPFPALRAFSFGAGLLLYGTVVMPYRALSRFPQTRSLASRFPLQSYASYPISVIINDQFDRFSAPIENRYREHEVRAWFEHSKLRDVCVLPGYGWRAAGRVSPASE